MPDKTEHHHTSVHHNAGLTTSLDWSHEHANGEKPHSHDVEDPKVIRELVTVPDDKPQSHASRIWYGDKA